MTGTVMTNNFEQVFVNPAGSYSLTIPSGTRIMSAWVQAAGGSGKGRTSPPVDGSAGGGGGFAFITREVQSTEWGNTLTLVVGAGSAGNNGGNSTLSGTVGGGSISITANGGGKGTAFFDGTGGTATGGDTNLTGQDGSGYVSTPPGEESPGVPGKSGGIYNGGAADPFVGVPNVLFFAPGEGGYASSIDVAGWDGYITVRFV